MTRDEMVSVLRTVGFKPHSTASKKWRQGYFRCSGERTMLVLVRRGGVDLLVTNLTHEAMTNQDGLLSVQTHNPGDDFVEYHYTNAGEDIHSKVIAAVKNLVESGTLGGSYLKKVGLSRSEWAAHHAKPNGTDVVFDEDKVRYAEFTIVETNDIGYELLDPEDTASPQRIRDLQECLRGGIIRSLTIKYGICFAAYADGRHRSHALMDYSVAHKLGGRVPIHPPRQQTRGQYRTVLRGLDEYCHLESDRAAPRVSRATSRIRIWSEFGVLSVQNTSRRPSGVLRTVRKRGDRKVRLRITQSRVPQNSTNVG